MLCEMRSEGLEQETAHSRFPGGTDMGGGQRQTCVSNSGGELSPVHYISDLTKLSLSSQYLIPVTTNIRC